MNYELLTSIFLAQLISSLLRSLSVYWVANASRYKAVLITAISDLFFYLIVSGVVQQMISGNNYAVIFAVLGGAAGNWLAITYLNASKR